MLRNNFMRTGREKVINPFSQDNLLQDKYVFYGKTKRKKKVKKKRVKEKKKVKKKKKKKVKRRFLYNPNNPKKRF